MPRLALKVRAFAARLTIASCGAGVPALLALAASSLLACSDENDPKTWVKKLDDGGQRAEAATRLSEMFDARIGAANKNYDDPKVKELVDAAIEPLSSAYIASLAGVDEKTPTKLLKLVADMRDPRGTKALAKALDAYDATNDEKINQAMAAAAATTAMANAGKLTDQALIDSVWNLFSRFKASQSKSSKLIQNLHDAVLAVKSPSYGPKAMEKLSQPAVADDADSQKDQVQFWQLTSVQILKELHYGAAAKPLVTVMLTPTKGDIAATSNSALMTMPKDAEPFLIGALNGSDPTLNKMMKDYPDNAGMPLIADALSWLSRPAGKDALMAVYSKATDDTTRTVIAQNLTRYPIDQKIEDAITTTYKKVPAGTRLAFGKTPPLARPLLVQVASLLFDPALTDWLVKEIPAAKGDDADSMLFFGIDSATKLMDKPRAQAVMDLAAKNYNKGDQEPVKAAVDLVNKCDKDTGCYLAALDESPPPGPAATMKLSKAAWMLGIYGMGKADVKAGLLGKIDKVKDPGARLAMVNVLDRLAPQGDNAAADALDKIVKADLATGNTALIKADDPVVKVSLRLRARATP